MNECRRDTSIDLAKGIAIIAIVLGHVLRGLVSAGIVDGESSIFLTWDRMLYMFHLSLFAFLSALFVRRVVERDGRWVYLRSRNVTFLYLYVVWSAVQGLVKLLTAALVNSPTTIIDILKIWVPEGQLWFLPWLVVMTTATIITRPWRSLPASILALAAAAVVSAVFWGFSGSLVGTQGLGLTVFFFAGAVWGASGFIQMTRAVSMRVWWLVALASWVTFVYLVSSTHSTTPTFGSDGRSPLSVVLGVFTSAAGVVGVIAISRLLSNLEESIAWLTFIGQRTLEIFLAHIIAASGTRIVLEIIGVDIPGVQIVAGTVLGIALPLLLWWCCRSVQFVNLFEAPRQLTGSNRVFRSEAAEA